MQVLRYSAGLVHGATCLVDEHPVGDAVLVDAGGCAEAGRTCADDDDTDLHVRTDRVIRCRPTSNGRGHQGTAGQSYTKYLLDSGPPIGSPSATQPPSLQKIGALGGAGKGARMGGDDSGR